MTFTSLTFFGFVLISLIVYYIVPKKFRWIVLLVASTAFYCICCLKYLPFLVFTSLSVWAGAIWLDRVNSTRKSYLKEHKQEWSSDEKKKYKQTTQTHKRLILALILVLNFGILAVLKYYGFFAEWLGGLLNIRFPSLGILLPLGISFYTFQTMGYVIDVYWEKVSPERNFFKAALFTSFFPQIVQGPIAFYSELAGQLYEGHELKYENIKYGFQLILWGLFQKMVIADRLAVIVTKYTAEKGNLDHVFSAILVFVYCIQLYMDFAGGIDIARGVGCMFGINMAINFKRPYFSKSVSEFWRRWHITLGRWLRTYLFYPMAVSKLFLKFGRVLAGKGTNEKELPEDSLWGGFTFRQHFARVFPGCVATLITFFVIGMWHGANWRYAGYGLWSGLVIMVSMILDPVFKWLIRKLKIRTKSLSWRVWQIVRTFLLIYIGSAFDLGDNFTDSLRLIRNCFTFTIHSNLAETFKGHFSFTPADYIIMTAGLMLVFAVSLYQERTGKVIREQLDKQMIWFQWGVMLIGLFSVVLLGMYGPGVAANEFVYMGF